MRPPNKNRNNRNKSGRKPMGNVSSRVYESAGPEGKVRGTPQQIIEKYLNMARDSQTSGDRVMSENFLQHAEHYIRLLSAAQQQLDDRRSQGQPGARDGGDAGDEDDFEGYADRFTQPERAAPPPEERPAHQGAGGGQSMDPRDQAREHDRPRREHGQERSRDARDQERPRRDGDQERPRRERHDDRPRREDGAARGDVRSQPAIHAVQRDDALDTINTVDDSALGLVATPENAEPRMSAPAPLAPIATPAHDASGVAAPHEGAVAAGAAPDAAEKPAEPRRRRRRAPAAEAASGAAAEAASGNSAEAASGNVAEAASGKAAVGEPGSGRAAPAQPAVSAAADGAQTD